MREENLREFDSKATTRTLRYLITMVLIQSTVTPLSLKCISVVPTTRGFRAIPASIGHRTVSGLHPVESVAGVARVRPGGLGRVDGDRAVCWVRQVATICGWFI